MEDGLVRPVDEGTPQGGPTWCRSSSAAGSSGANPFACIAAGIACLWGSAHGGANEAKDKNDPFRLMGFGQLGDVVDGADLTEHLESSFRTSCAVFCMIFARGS